MSKKKPLPFVPPDIEALFGAPPLLSTEDPRRYWEIVDRFAEFVEPKNIVEWMWLKDIVDLCWEINRLRRFRTLIIENELPGEDADDAEDAHDPEADSVYNFRLLLGDYETIDKLLTAAELRRDRIFRELELRRERIAPLLRRASDQMIEDHSQEITLAPK